MMVAPIIASSSSLLSCGNRRTSLVGDRVSEVIAKLVRAELENPRKGSSKAAAQRILSELVKLGEPQVKITVIELYLKEIGVFDSSFGGWKLPGPSPCVQVKRKAPSSPPLPPLSRAQYSVVADGDAPVCAGCAQPIGRFTYVECSQCLDYWHMKCVVGVRSTFLCARCAAQSSTSSRALRHAAAGEAESVSKSQKKFDVPEDNDAEEDFANVEPTIVEYTPEELELLRANVPLHGNDDEVERFRRFPPTEEEWQTLRVNQAYLDSRCTHLREAWFGSHVCFSHNEQIYPSVCSPHK